MLLRVERLREARERRGWSQRELGERCGLSDNQIYRYENGKSDPSASHLKIMADQLGVSTDYLLGISNNPDPQAPPGGLLDDERDLLESYRRDGWLGVLRLM